METREALIAQIYAVADKRGYEVIESNLDAIIKGLLKRKQTKGGYYCPCRIVKDDEEWKKNIICPCIFLDEEIKEKGKCHCNLYQKQN